MTKRIADMTPEQRETHREKRRDERRRFRAKIKADPEKYEKYLGEKRRWHARVKADPKRHRARLDRLNAFRAKKKADPASRAAWLAEERACYARRCRDPEKRAAIVKSWRKSERKKKRQRAHAVIARVRAALPSSMPPHVRDEIAQNMLVAMAERRLKHADIEARAREFVRAHNREFDPFKTLSLDAPIPGMGGMTYVDRLVSEAD